MYNSHFNPNWALVAGTMCSCLSHWGSSKLGVIRKQYLLLTNPQFPSIISVHAPHETWLISRLFAYGRGGILVPNRGNGLSEIEVKVADWQAPVSKPQASHIHVLLT